MTVTDDALQWEEVARALAEELDELSEYIDDEHDFAYWKGYDDAKGWAWLWFGLTCLFAAAFLVVLVFG